MRKICYLILLLSATFNANSQENNAEKLNWLNKNAVDLKSTYLKTLSAQLSQNVIVGLGEASHGTEEFFQEKNKIVKYLITDQKYTQIGFEVPDEAMAKVNDYVTLGKGDLKVLLKDFRLYHTKSFSDLFEWVKNYNLDPKHTKIEVFGFDNVSYTDPFERDSLMAKNAVERQTKTKTKMIVWSHNLHLLKDTTGGYKAFGYFLNKHYKTDFFNIAFDTYQGKVNTISVNEDGTSEVTAHQLEIPTTGFTALFAKAKYDSFFINFLGVNPFSGVKDSITNIWADWRAPYAMPIRLANDFDAIIFIKNTTASLPLN